MNRNSVLMLMALMLSTVACSLRHNNYSDFRNFDESGWAYTDTIAFTPELEDSVATGMLTLCVRHTNAYPYSNLWVELQYPAGDTTVLTDTLQLILADDFGRWYGKGSGVSYQFTDTVSRSFTLYNGIPLKLRSIMRRDTLGDIEQIGVIFDSSTSNIKK